MPALTRPTAAAPALDDKAVAARLRRLDSAYRTRWFGLMLLGVLVCWIGPVFFTMIIWYTQFWAHSDATDLHITFAWCCAVGIPLLFVLEYFTRGMFYDGPDGASVDSMGGDSAANRAGAFALMIEISLWGPRMVITGVRRLRSDGRFGNATRKAAAQLVACLIRAEDGGMDTTHLFTRCALDGDLFADALAYLIYHDRIGVSKDGARLWLLSDARKRIMAS